MQQLRDVVLSPLGRPIAGATITVTLAAGGAATLYSDDGVTALGSNVLTSDAGGEYVFYAANGRYTLTIVATGYTTTTRDEVLWDQADLASTATGKGAGLVGDAPLLNYAVGTIGAAVHDIALDVNNISGVDPTGAASSSTALSTFFGLIGNGYTAKFRGTYSLTGQVAINSKNISVDCRAATFNLTGNNAGFKVGGTVTEFTVLGGRYVGDGVNRDASSTTAQAAWIIGNGTGDSVQNVRVFGGYCTLTNIGWKFAAGVGPFAKTLNCHISGATAYDIRGYAGGCGYGIQASQADGLSIVGCIADTCQRHGIYIAEGRKYALSANQTIRCGKSDGTIRGALCISRSAEVSVAGHISADNGDVGLEIDTDAQGTAPDNVMTGVTVDGYVAYGNTYGDLRIGTVDPATDGVPKNVTVRGRARITAAQANASVVINCGERVKIDLDIDGSAAGATFRAVTFNAYGGATYSKDIEVYGSIDSAGYGVQVETALQTGTSRIVIRPARLTCTVAEYNFIGGEDATTNNNLLYWRSNRKATRSYTSSGTNITIPVGGLDALTLTASGATTVANFSGGAEGQELVCHFGNGNTTLKNTNFYTAGAADFVGTANDTLTLIYIGAAWREKCRSVN